MLDHLLVGKSISERKYPFEESYLSLPKSLLYIIIFNI